MGTFKHLMQAVIIHFDVQCLHFSRVLISFRINNYEMLPESSNILGDQRGIDCCFMTLCLPLNI